MKSRNVEHSTETHHYSLCRRDALIAFDAIAVAQVRNRCDCEDDTGYKCQRCKRLIASGVDVFDWDSEVAYRYARILEKRSRVKNDVR